MWESVSLSTPSKNLQDIMAEVSLNMQKIDLNKRIMEPTMEIMGS